MYPGHYRSGTPPPYPESPQSPGGSHNHIHHPHAPDTAQRNEDSAFVTPNHFRPRAIEPSVFLKGPDEMVGFCRYTSSWHPY